MRGAQGESIEAVRPWDDLEVVVDYVASERVEQPHVSFGISDERIDAFTVATTLVDGQRPEAMEGEGRLRCIFHGLPLRPRTYDVWFSVRTSDGVSDVVGWQKIGSFRVAGEQDEDLRNITSVTHTRLFSPVIVRYSWRFE
jgi:hypothetical protein